MTIKDCKTCPYYGEDEEGYCEFHGEKIPVDEEFKCDQFVSSVAGKNLIAAPGSVPPVFSCSEW